jgi:membrane protein DedA with SNARE-associated domain
MEGEMIIQFLTDYGYMIMFVLMVPFQPIVTLIGAFMASQGIFNVFVVFCVSIFGSLVGDTLLYMIGRKWGMRFVQRFGRYVGVTQQRVLRMEDAFLAHGAKIVIGVKSTTGLCWVTFIAAGILRMRFRNFLLYTLIGGVIWSGGLTIVGYFFGYMYAQIVDYISYAGWIVFGAMTAVVVLWYVYKRMRTPRFLKKLYFFRR